MRKFTTEELIELVRRRASLSGTAADGTDDEDLADYLSEALISRVAPEILRTREEYMVVEEHIQLQSAQRRYRIPERAMGAKLRSVTHVDATPTPTVRTPVYRTTRQANEDGYGFGVNTTTSERGLRYFLQGNDIILVGTEWSLTGYLEVAYFFRPGELVLAADYRRVATVTPATKSITLDSAVPAGWSDADLFDVHAGKAGGEIKVWDAAATLVSGSDMTFTAAIDGSSPFGRKAIEVGDYVVLAENAAIPMGVPRELHPLLAQSAISLILASQGDTEARNVARSELEGMWRAGVPLVEQRVEGKPKKLRPKRYLWGSGRGYGGSRRE